MLTVAPYVLPRIMTRPPPERRADTGETAAPTVIPPPPPPAAADPELTLIAQWVEDLKTDLARTRALLEERERAHAQEVREFRQALDDRDRMIARLESTLDALTGRTPPTLPPPPMPRPPV